jgi:DNA-directed RNA polymerase subunit RPC12/RpoP
VFVFVLRGNDRKVHERVHTDRKRYKCLKCGKSLKYKLSLNGHTNNHLGITEFECIDCGKQFGLFENLQPHIYLYMAIKHMETCFFAVFVIMIPEENKS